MKKAKQIINPPKSLTAVELEMMNVIWRVGPCTVAQILEHLKPSRKLAYTSVSTIVRILEQKGYVLSEREGRGHAYSAAISKEAYQAKSLRNLLNNVFDGTPTLLVQRLLDSETLGDDEIAEIRSLLRKQER